MQLISCTAMIVAQPGAVALIQPIAWELTCATDEDLKKKIKKTTLKVHVSVRSEKENLKMRKWLIYR